MDRIRIRAPLVLAALVLVALAATAAPAAPSAAQAGLRIGGSVANFGVYSLVGGFLPDPAAYSVVSGGSINASSMGMGCRGYVTAQPDVIVRYTRPASWVRFFVRAGGDTTLVINDAAGRWWCSDDDGGYPNPMVDISSPSGGQYDIWVGSYRAGETIGATLYVTEISANRP